jgi:nucleotide-binding universal stress UspA family protein
MCSPSGSASFLKVPDATMSRDGRPFAVREARRRDADLLAITVVDLPPHIHARYGIPDLVMPLERMRDQARTDAHRQLHEFGTVLDGPGYTGTVKVLSVIGDPATELVRHTASADLLVVGHHRGGGRFTMLGSTAITCVLHAACTVCVVPR